MRVSRRVDAITALQRLSRPRLPVVATPLAGRSSSGWIPVTFQNGWSNLEETTQTVEYRKSADNLVKVRGFAKRSAGNSALPIFTFPEGFWPPARDWYPANGNDGATISYIGVQVAPDGQVVPSSASGLGWIALAGISFYTD